MLVSVLDEYLKVTCRAEILNVSRPVFRIGPASTPLAHSGRRGGVSHPEGCRHSVVLENGYTRSVLGLDRRPRDHSCKFGGHSYLRDRLDVDDPSLAMRRGAWSKHQERQRNWLALIATYGEVYASDNEKRQIGRWCLLNEQFLHAPVSQTIPRRSAHFSLT